MGLVFWWILVVWVLAITGYWVVRYILLKRKQAKGLHEHEVPVAHSARLAALPEYKLALKRYKLLVYVCLGTLSLSLIIGMLLSARPARIALITPAQQSRDIMLCLDVSGSVLRADSALVNRFTALVTNFSDQKFGLTVFNSSSIAKIPLNDDYQFTTEQLAKVGTALSEQEGQDFIDLTSGTLANFDKGTSLVSDGITSCINNLGENPLKRSQSVILATDNESNGTPIIEMQQAIALAKERNIRVYAIDSGIRDEARSEDHTALRQLADNTGGNYFELADTNAVVSIIDDISTQEAKYAASASVVAVTDKPQIFMYIVFVVTVGSLVLVWRLKI